MRRIGFFLAFLGMAVVHSTSAETKKLRPLKPRPTDVGFTVIINGKLATKEDYPVSFQSGMGERICTWFLVGDQALVGAAHCVAGADADAPMDDLQFDADGTSHTASCSVSPEYWTDASQDWAICKVSPPHKPPAWPVPKVAGYEVINSRPDRVAEQTRIEISGFGCTAPGAGVEKDYWVGTAKIAKAPPGVHVIGSVKAMPQTIKIQQSPSVLCEGDSGGPAFLYQRSSGDKNNGVHRVVIGLNSSTVILAGVSYLSSTSTPKATAFFRNWALKNEAKICGISTGYSACRPFLK